MRREKETGALYLKIVAIATTRVAPVVAHVNSQLFDGLQTEPLPSRHID